MTKPKPGQERRSARDRAYANIARGATDARIGGDKDRAPESVPGQIGQAQRLVGDS